MPQLIAVKALIYVLMAITVAIIIRPRYDNDSVSVRIISYWILGAIVAFLVDVPAIELPTLAVLLILLSPPKLEHRAAFLLCTFFALPRFISWHIPFPGINYLLQIDHASLVSLTVALPTLFMSRGLKSWEKDPVPRNRLMDTVFISLALLIAVLDARDTTLTNGLRNIIYALITYLIPYLAITRSLRSREAFRALIYGLTTVGAIVVFLAFLTVVQNWNHYEHSGNSAAFASTSARAGSKRVNLTMMHTLAGLAMCAAFAASWHAARHAPKIKVAAYPLLFLSVVGLLGTFSRGAWIGFIMMIGTMLLLRVKSWNLRLLLGGGAAIGLISLFLVLQASGFSNVDAYGTFDYRSELLKAGLDYIPVHPFFGSTGYADDPHFSHLVQGQGIIDFVNGYLQYVLRWGLVGLSMFAMLWTMSLISAVRGMDRFAANGAEDIQLKSFGIGFVGFFIAFLFTFGTTSDISYYPFIMTALISIGHAYGRVSKIPLPNADKKAMGEADLQQTQQAQPIELSGAAKPVWSG